MNKSVIDVLSEVMTDELVSYISSNEFYNEVLTKAKKSSPSVVNVDINAETQRLTHSLIESISVPVEVAAHDIMASYVKFLKVFGNKLTPTSKAD